MGEHANEEGRSGGEIPRGAIELVPATSGDADAIAGVFTNARKGMTYLPESPYSEEETVTFFRRLIEDADNMVLEAMTSEGHVAGFGVFGEGRADHLYVDPAYHGHGVGSQLLKAAQERYDHLEGWVFEKNTEALKLYERNGFKVAERTDGSRNEEHEPDVRIVWSRRNPIGSAVPQ